MYGDSAFIGRSSELKSALTTLTPAGSNLVVSGVAGIGKTAFVRQVARRLRENAPLEVVRIRSGWGARGAPFHAFIGVLPELMENEHPTVHQALSLATEFLVRPGTGTLLIADDAHEYDGASLELLAALAVSPGVRVIITTRGGRRTPWQLERLERDGYAERITLDNLTFPESKQLVCTIFDTEEVETVTALHLHCVSGGNPLLLSRYARSLLKSGSVFVRGPIAHWNGSAPCRGSIADLFAAELTELSPIERATLLAIAVSEPLPQTIAHSMCDDGALNSLVLDSFITLDREHGTPQFRVAHQLIAAAARDAATPGELISAGLAFLAALPPILPEHSPDLILRAVAVSIELGQPIRLVLLRRAFAVAQSSGDPQLTVQIADALSAHPAATRSERIEARALVLPLLREVDPERLKLVTLPKELAWILPQPGDDEELLMRRVSLGFAVFDELLRRDDDPHHSLELAQRLHALIPSDALPVLTRFALELSQRLGSIGRFDEALALAHSPHLSSQNRVGRLKNASMRCVILGQQGKVNEAREIANRELPLAETHLPSVPDAANSLFAAWYRVANLAGRVQTMATLQQEFERRLERRKAKLFGEANLSEVATGMLAVAEGRWQDASGRLGAAVSRLTVSDPAGHLVSTSALAAFAYAAAGQFDDARAEVQRCTSLPLADSRSVEGIIRLNLVRARIWLGEYQLASEHAARLVDWAQERRLALVELRALHLLCMAGGRDPELVRRAESLVSVIDGMIGPAIVGQLRAMHANVRLSEDPSTRQLARLGIWLPLPVGNDLTGREREIAGFAALGYSNKWIGTSLQISRRTVETHLAHVYLKLGITERDSLGERLFSLQEREDAIF